jgi:hypothetical protein
MSFRMFLSYLELLLYILGSIICIWFLVRVIALVNAMTRYFNSRATSQIQTSLQPHP